MTTFDKDKAERLVAECREDDERMTPGNWQVGTDEYECAATLRAQPIRKTDGMPDGDPVEVIIPFGRAYSDAAGIARTRNNLRELAEQLEAACGEVERLRGCLQRVTKATHEAVRNLDDRAQGSMALACRKAPTRCFCGMHISRTDELRFDIHPPGCTCLDGGCANQATATKEPLP